MQRLKKNRGLRELSSGWLSFIALVTSAILLWFIQFKDLGINLIVQLDDIEVWSSDVFALIAITALLLALLAIPALFVSVYFAASFKILVDRVIEGKPTKSHEV